MTKIKNDVLVNGAEEKAHIGNSPRLQTGVVRPHDSVLVLLNKHAIWRSPIIQAVAANARKLRELRSKLEGVIQSDFLTTPNIVALKSMNVCHVDVDWRKHRDHAMVSREHVTGRHV